MGVERGRSMTREEALSKVKGYLTDLLPSEEYDEAEEITKVLKPKTGHWINIDETHSKCDRCGAVFEISSENGEANYCPHCGAKMIDAPDINVGSMSEIQTGSESEDEE